MPIQPVSVDYRGAGEFASPSISFDDYSRMAIQVRKQSGERRLPTPSWAVNQAELREVLAVYLEKRAHIKPGIGSYFDRLSRAQTLLKRSCSGKIKTLDGLCKRYVELKQAEPTSPRLRKLEIQIEALDTQIRLEKKGFAPFVAGVIYYYYRCGLDSVGTGQQLGIKPPQARKILFELHKAWDQFHGRELEYQARSARLKMAWTRRKAGLPARGRDPRVVRLYLSGMRVPDIAVAVGYKPNNGHFVIRARLRDAGVWKPESRAPKSKAAQA